MRVEPRAGLRRPVPLDRLLRRRLEARADRERATGELRRALPRPPRRGLAPPLARVEEGALDAYIAALEARGLRIVDRGDYGDGDATAFISPRTAPGILVQFWQVPGFRGARPPTCPTTRSRRRSGVRFRVDHLAFAVRALDAGARLVPADLPGRRCRVPRAGAGTGRTTSSTSGSPTTRSSCSRHRRRDRRLRRSLPRASRRGCPPPRRRRRSTGRARRAARRRRYPSRRPDAELAGGRATAFVHPRDAHGVLVQFWQEPEFGGPRRP